MKQFNAWLNDDYFDPETKAELRAIADDEKEIEDRFFRTLEFGTGGLRGVIGAGMNRMNYYTVGKATQGLSNYILKQNVKNPSVVIAYDSRRYSPEFAERCALILAANGIKAYLFDELQPTPLLSYAVRELGCVSGIMITASHNPPEYNGYKAYWDDGGQVVSPCDTDIIREVEAIGKFSDCKLISAEDAKKAGLLVSVGKEVVDKYMAEVMKQSINPDFVKKSGDCLKIVYTPLNGAGNKPVRRALSQLGFTNVDVVPEQENPDPNFTTLEYPNPEDPKAFLLALALAVKKEADIIIATDPDSDRMGAAIRDNDGSYFMLTGNMIGALLCEYVISGRSKNGTLPKNAAVVSTIVSTAMTKAITKAYGVDYFEVLTGFKNIAEKIRSFEKKGTHEFVYGFEESYGYLAGTHARDKDAVVASMLICEYAAVLKAEGKILKDALNDIYKKYGYYKENTQSLTLKGAAGLAAIKTIMERLRSNPPEQVAGRNVVKTRDYKKRITTDMVTGMTEGITLPVSDVLYFELEDSSWFCVRPSGTEPKIKMYFGVTGETEADADTTMKEVSAGAMYIINKEIP